MSLKLNKIIFCLPFIMGANFIFAGFSIDNLTEEHKQKIVHELESMEVSLVHTEYIGYSWGGDPIGKLASSEEIITEILKKYPMNEQEQSEWLVDIASKPIRSTYYGPIYALDCPEYKEGALSSKEKVKLWSKWREKLNEALLPKKE
ncbi:MAG: hypothetical protein AB7R69_05895 [Candidatus Babeliales bacterium]